MTDALSSPNLVDPLETLRLHLRNEGVVLDDLEVEGGELGLRFRAREGEEPPTQWLPPDLPGLESIVGALLARRRGGLDRDLVSAALAGDLEPQIGTALGAWGDNPRDGGLSAFVPLDLGPLHAITRGRFRLLLKLDGETIERAALETGFARRGLESLLPQVGWTGALPLLDRWIEGDSVFPRLAWCGVLERAADVVVPPSARRLRVLAAELSRLTSHALSVGDVLRSLGDVLHGDALAEAGRRLASAWSALGAVEGRAEPGGFEGGPRDGTDFDRGLDAELRFLVEILGEVHALTFERSSFRERLRGRGRIDAGTARAFGASGPVLRATGVALDARHDEDLAHSPWRGAGLRPESVLGEGGDLLARCEVRLAEMRASLRLVDRLREEGFDGARRTDDTRFAPLGPASGDLQVESWRSARARGRLDLPAGRHRARVEAAQGTLGIAVEIGEEGELVSVRLRGPDLFHANLLDRALPGTALDDLAPVIASFDLRGGGIDA